MEVILFLIVAGVIGGVFFIDKHTRKRAITIARSNKAISPAQKEIDDADLKKMFKDLRDAKTNEQKVLTEDWDAKFIDLLPDSDPLKQVVLRKKAGINSEEAKYTVPIPAEFVAEELSYSIRITRNVAVLREAPTLQSNTISTILPSVGIRVDGWVRGETINDNSVWFRVDDSNGVYATSYVWSGSMTNIKTSGLPEVQPGQRSLAPAAKRDLEREIQRLNAQIKALPKERNFATRKVTNEELSDFLVKQLKK